MSYNQERNIERDLCLLYYQLSECGSFNLDLDFENVYTQKYWQWIDIDHEIRSKALVILLIIVINAIKGREIPEIGEIKRAIEVIYPLSEEEDLLIEAIKEGLALIGRCYDFEKKSRAFLKSTEKLYTIFVEGYFKNLAV